MSEKDYSLPAVGPIITDCKELFDAQLSEKELERVRSKLETLLVNSAHYRSTLTDAQHNARSEASREIAAELEREDMASEQFQQVMFPNIRSGEDMSDDELNVAALYVEYLANRAAHSIDQAWIAAYRLKLLSHSKGMA